MILPVLGALGLGGALTVASVAYPPIGTAVLLFLRNAGAWLSRRSLGEIACIGMGLALVGALLWGDHWKAVATIRQQELVKCQNVRAADRTNYIKAQKDAQALNDAQIARVKQRQQEITDATITHLDQRLELIRRGLPKSGTPTTPNTTGSPKTGDTSQGPCRAFDPAWLCLSPEERLRAAENEERHDELIDWVEQQSALDPNAK